MRYIIDFKVDCGDSFDRAKKIAGKYIALRRDFNGVIIKAIDASGNVVKRYRRQKLAAGCNWFLIDKGGDA